MPYKEFANGNPLPASDIDTYLMDQAVMTFANSTARSTAIPSPKEGMLTYLEDTNAYEGWTGSAWVNINDNSAAIPLSTVTTAGDLIVANGNASVTRLGIGSNGQVLSSNGTTATWITPAGGGGETLISTTTLTGGTIELASIPQTYKDLKIVIRNYKPVTDNDFMQMWWNSTFDVYETMDTYGAGGNLSFGEYWIRITAQTDNSVDKSLTVIEIPDYTNTTTWKMGKYLSLNVNGTTTTNFNYRTYEFCSSITNAISNIKFNSNGGNFTSGTVLLYGVS